MKQSKAAVIPSKGIGDALLMMIASHQLHLQGYQVTTYHPKLHELETWFPGHHFGFLSSPEQLANRYDLIVVQNDNSKQAQVLKQLKPDHVSLFYAGYQSQKHLPLTSTDQILSTAFPMADNIALAIANLLKLPTFSKSNGLCVPGHLCFQKFEKRILIHPSSSEPKKNWEMDKFIDLATRLKQRGYEPYFVLSKEEEQQWKKQLPAYLPIVFFPNLDQLAAFVYESALVIGNDSLLGHLASNLNLPTIIVGPSKRQMKLWRPAWRKGVVITPSRLIPNIKGLRLRDRYWRMGISVRRVLGAVDAFTL